MTKVSYIDAALLAADMGLKFRPYNRHGATNPARTVVKAPGNSEADKKLLMDFIKTLKLKAIFYGAKRQRYFKGGSHYMVCVSTAQLQKVKVKVKAVPAAPPPKVAPPDLAPKMEPNCAAFNRGFEAVASHFEEAGYTGLASDVRRMLRESIEARVRLDATQR
jgi:hypothetical protein